MSRMMTDFGLIKTCLLLIALLISTSGAQNVEDGKETPESKIDPVATPETVTDPEPMELAAIPDEAPILQSRHQVSVRERKYDFMKFGGGHFCGGSLIAPDVVLTSAHCLQPFKPSDVLMVMGNLDRFSRTDIVQIMVHKVKIHQGYKDGQVNNDIALAFLKESVPETATHIYPIDLNRHDVKNGTLCHTTGWGYMETGDTVDPLRIDDVIMMTRYECEKILENETIIYAGMLCNGNRTIEGKGPCTGDSGGPLVCNGLLAGVVSFGAVAGCSSVGIPDIYSDVNFFHYWIEAEVKRYRNAQERGKMYYNPNGSQKLSASYLAVALIAALSFLLEGSHRGVLS